MKKKSLILFVFLSISSFGQRYLHREGQKVVDGKGENIILRGLGLGGWMVQEGYMLKTGGFAGSQSAYKSKVTELIGVKNTEEFYKAYLKNGITKRDIDSLAKWGFNSVRLPMHYNLYTLPIEKETVAGQNTWLEEGFKMTDDLLDWCATNKIYLILDLHAAPGGQGIDSNISDFDKTKPSLWDSTANQDKTVALWRKLAERYKDSPWIAAYDIINEPNWDFSSKNPKSGGCDEKLNIPLRDLQIRITKAIREVDVNHLIFIEGNCWGNNYEGIFPLWDENLGLSFHKYSNKNDVAAIQTMLDYRTQHNVPIWCGESGENSNQWFKDAITLLETNNIGWSLWPMKKIDDIVGIGSVATTPEYQQLLKYWKDGGEKPTEAFAKKALMQIAENFKMEHLTIQYDVIDAMFRQVQTNDTKTYKKHSLPGVVFATEYDLGQNEVAYFDKVAVKYDWTTKYNIGEKLRNDGVDITVCTDKATNGFQVSSIEDGEWLQFTFDSKKKKTFNVAIRYSSEAAGGKLYLEQDGVKISETIVLPSTGGLSTFNSIELKKVELKKGKNKVRVRFVGGNFNLNYLEFKKA